MKPSYFQRCFTMESFLWPFFGIELHKTIVNAVSNTGHELLHGKTLLHERLHESIVEYGGGWGLKAVFSGKEW